MNDVFILNVNMFMGGKLRNDIQSVIQKVGVCEHVGSALATVWSRIRHEILVYFMFEMCIPCDVNCIEIWCIEMSIF